MPNPSPKSPLGLEKIKDARVLSAMRDVGRELFVPEDVRVHAYEDRALPIGHGQSISQPYIVALMTELLDLKGTEKVLEIGTGSGYQTAVLSGLAGEVYSIEIIPELAQRAAIHLHDYANVHLQEGDGYHGWAAEAPFDAIIVTCSPDHVPAPLTGQLKEGGRMVIPVGQWQKEQMLHQLEKINGELVRHPVIPVSFVPMTGKLHD